MFGVFFSSYSFFFGYTLFYTYFFYWLFLIGISTTWCYSVERLSLGGTSMVSSSAIRGWWSWATVLLILSRLGWWFVHKKIEKLCNIFWLIITSFLKKMGIPYFGSQAYFQGWLFQGIFRSLYLSLHMFYLVHAGQSCFEGWKMIKIKKTLRFVLEMLKIEFCSSWAPWWSFVWDWNWN